MPDFVHILALVVVNVLMAWALWFPISAGQFSMGTPGVIAVGAYAAALLAQQQLGGLLLGVAAGGLAGLLISIPLVLISFRLSQFPFAIVTLGLAEVVRITINNIPALGGPMGILGLPTTVDAVWLGLFLCIAVVLFSWWVGRTSIGRAIDLVSHDELQASALAIRPSHVKWLTILIAGLVGGMAGAIQVHYSGLAEPNSFGFGLTVQLFAFAVLGGTSTFWGPVLGASFLTVSLDLLSAFGQFSYIVFGLLLLVVMRWRPDGLLTRNRSLRRRRIGRWLAAAAAGDARTGAAAPD